MRNPVESGFHSIIFGKGMAMNNLFISYDLISPGQNYNAVTEAIQGMGYWAKVHYSLYYVSTDLDEKQALTRVQVAADRNDKIIVISALSAVWTNLLPEVSQQMRDNWNR